MELAPDPNVLGWYEHGPEPGGGSGSVVMGGHLDSREFGIGQFARLDDAAAGDVVTVQRAAGERSRYRVADVRRVPRAEVPMARLFRRDGAERLVLITCAGEFDPDRGGYQENLIVTAVPS